MKRILVTGACGQVGSELTMALRDKYGNDNVVASEHITPLNEQIVCSGPFHSLDCTDIKSLEKVVTKYDIGTIYHLAIVLSASAEANPQLAWNVNINGLYNVLEISREHKCRVFNPSTIGVFGPTTPLDNTPQVTIQRPNTIYGVTKLTGELLCDYYYKRFGIDARGVRWPGVISYITPPGGGTTDYAVEMYYEAVTHRKYAACFIKEGTYMDLIYMHDAIKAAMQIMEADPSKLRYRNAYNVAAISCAPENIAGEIKKIIPDFTVEYKIDPIRQAIAESWPNKMDDSAAREDWGWQPEHDLASMTKDMLLKLSEKLKVAL